MLKYKFSSREIDWSDKTVKLVESIKYKCLICGTTFDWDDKWEEVRKLHIKEEVDQHHNEHIIP
jgi:predicted restriction endonuclease